MTLAEIEVALRQGAVEQLIARVEHQGDTGHLLARALRRVAVVLQARPQLALPALQRVGVCTPAIAPLLEGWAAEWAAAKRGAWLKALTAPVYGLESALRRIVPDAEPEPAFPVQRLQRLDVSYDKAPQGFFAIRDTNAHEQWLIPNPAHAYFRHAIYWGTDTAMVSGWALDDDGIVARVNLSTQTIDWISMFWKSVDGVVPIESERLFVEDCQFGYLVDAHNGDVIKKFHALRGGLRISANGQLVTVRIGGRLHEFEVDLLCHDSRTLGGDPRAAGFVNVQFSVDGALLVAGLMMVDAITGRTIKEIDADRGGYLEGGPPLRGRRVVPSGFVETGPKNGTQRWNARGDRLPCVNTRFAHWHELTFSDDGNAMAMAEG